MALKLSSGLCWMALVSIGVGLGGCGDIAYKTGAGSGEFTTASHSCQQTSTDQEHYQACMRAQGWSLTNLSADDPNAAAAPISASQSTPPASSAAIGAPQQAPAPGKPEAKSYLVQSWWKLGGSDGDLNGSIDACVTKLGEGERPVSMHGPISPPLLKCLRDSGWHGSIAKTS